MFYIIIGVAAVLATMVLVKKHVQDQTKGYIRQVDSNLFPYTDGDTEIGCSCNFGENTSKIFIVIMIGIVAVTAISALVPALVKKYA